MSLKMSGWDAQIDRILEHYGVHVFKTTEKYVIRYFLKLFRLFGYGRELQCEAIKR
jgi:UDP-galactopyranose mutase